MLLKYLDFSYLLIIKNFFFFLFFPLQTAEVYESIEDINGNNDESEKKLLKEFCNVSFDNCSTDIFYSRSRTTKGGERKKTPITTSSFKMSIDITFKQ